MVDSATLPHWEERALHAVDDVSEHRLNFRGVYGCWEGGAQKQLMVQGSRLVKERDSIKRNFEDMSATEQQVLDDFDTGKSAKRLSKECGKKLPCFRGKTL